MREHNTHSRRIRMRCVGVDLHKDQFVTCFLEEDGESTVEQFHLDTHSLEKFAAYCAEMTGSRLKRDAKSGISWLRFGTQ